MLSDIRGIFNRLGEDRISTADLIRELGEIDDPDAPWADWNARRSTYERAIESRQIAGLLKPFNVKPSTIRLREGSTPPTAKGYLREKFEEAFASYLS